MNLTFFQFTRPITVSLNAKYICSFLLHFFNHDESGWPKKSVLYEVCNALSVREKERSQLERYLIAPGKPDLLSLSKDFSMQQGSFTDFLKEYLYTDSTYLLSLLKAFRDKFDKSNASFHCFFFEKMFTGIHFIFSQREDEEGLDKLKEDLFCGLEGVLDLLTEHYKINLRQYKRYQDFLQNYYPELNQEESQGYESMAVLAYDQLFSRADLNQHTKQFLLSFIRLEDPHDEKIQTICCYFTESENFSPIEFELYLHHSHQKLDIHDFLGRLSPTNQINYLFSLLKEFLEDFCRYKEPIEEDSGVLLSRDADFDITVIDKILLGFNAVLSSLEDQKSEEVTEIKKKLFMYLTILDRMFAHYYNHAIDLPDDSALCRFSLRKYQLFDDLLSRHFASLNTEEEHYYLPPSPSLGAYRFFDSQVMQQAAEEPLRTQTHPLSGAESKVQPYVSR